MGSERIFSWPMPNRDGVPSTAVGYVLLLLAALVTYANVVRGGFIWDDNVFVINNPLIREPGRFWEIWLTREAADYWPLSYSFFWLAWRLFGENPAGYHLCNIVLHAVTAGLIWQVLRALGLRWGLLAALAFVVHPVNAEAVAWLFQVKTTLAAALAFASLLAWIHYVDRPRPRLYALSLALFLLSLLAKATTVTWPFVILGYLWWKRGRLGPREVKLASPFFAIALVLGLNGVLWYERTVLLPSEEVRSDGLLSRLAAAGWVYWFYLYKALLPLDLAFVYRRWPIPFTQVVQFIPTLALAAAFVAVWWRRRAPWARWLLIAMGFYFVALFPVLGFFDIYFMRFSLVADHFQYLAIIAVLAPVTELAARGLERLHAKAPFALAIPLVLLCALTIRQNRIYASEEAVWRDTVEKNPTAWLAWLNLGLMLDTAGRHEEALVHFQRSLEHKPDNFDAMAQIAKDYDRRGQEAEAVAMLRRALEANPNAPSATDILAQILARRGQVAEAVQLCTSLLKVKPRLPAVRNNCAVYLLEAGRTEEALAMWRELAVLDPRAPLTSNHRAAIGNIADALRDLDRIDEALVYYKRAVEVGYRTADSHFNCGVIFLNKRQPNDAVEHLTRAIALDPGNAEAVYVRGLAFAALQDGKRSCDDMAAAAGMGFSAAVTAHAACKGVHR
jgi:protein O-mannosyl-transferase